MAIESPMQHQRLLCPLSRKCNGHRIKQLLHLEPVQSGPLLRVRVIEKPIQTVVKSRCDGPISNGFPVIHAVDLVRVLCQELSPANLREAEGGGQVSQQVNNEEGREGGIIEQRALPV